MVYNAVQWQELQFLTFLDVWITLSLFPDWVLATVWSSLLWIGLAACSLSFLCLSETGKKAGLGCCCNPADKLQEKLFPGHTAPSCGWRLANVMDVSRLKIFYLKKWKRFKKLKEIKQSVFSHITISDSNNNNLH